MGSFTQPGCRDVEDALWHVNSARDHDGLPHISIETLEAMIRHPLSNMDSATLTPEIVASNLNNATTTTAQP
jgi:hypothetical protein